MITRRTALAYLPAGYVSTLVGAAWAEPLIPRRARTCPQCLSGIPAQRYQYGSRSAPKSVVSRLAILLPAGVILGAAPSATAIAATATVPATIGPTNAGPDQPKPERTLIKLYQLDDHRLVIDHCAVSNVAVQLFRNGQWILSLRGDQNRRADAGDPRDYEPREHIKRNEFHIALRCLGAAPEKIPANRIEAGKPILAALDVDPFFVENGVPRWLRVARISGDVEANWSYIDRVELEFYYR